MWSKNLFSHLFHFSLELSVKVRKNRHTHTHTHTRHQHRLLLMQSSECWHSNYAFFKRSYKSPHRATSSWQPNWSGIKPEEATVAPRAMQRRAKGTSAEQRAGSANQRVQRRALWVHLSRGESWEVKGLRLGRGRQTQHWEQDTVWLEHPNPVRMRFVWWKAALKTATW